MPRPATASQARDLQARSTLPAGCMSESEPPAPAVSQAGPDTEESLVEQTGLLARFEAGTDQYQTLLRSIVDELKAERAALSQHRAALVHDQQVFAAERDRLAGISQQTLSQVTLSIGKASALPGHSLCTSRAVTLQLRLALRSRQPCGPVRRWQALHDHSHNPQQCARALPVRRHVQRAAPPAAGRDGVPLHRQRPPALCHHPQVRTALLMQCRA